MRTHIKVSPCMRSKALACIAFREAVHNEIMALDG